MEHEIFCKGDIDLPKPDPSLVVFTLKEPEFSVVRPSMSMFCMPRSEPTIVMAITGIIVISVHVRTAPQIKLASKLEPVIRKRQTRALLGHCS